MSERKKKCEKMDLAERLNRMWASPESEWRERVDLFTTCKEAAKAIEVARDLIGNKLSTQRYDDVLTTWWLKNYGRKS